MSLIKRSDVKNHLSTRRKTLMPFRPVSQPDATGNPEGEPRDAKVAAPGSDASPGQPSSPSSPAEKS